MSLSCDCYPGCWGDHSKDWTLVEFKGGADKSMTRAAIRLVVPYGSYVEMPDGIRVEPGYQDRVKCE
jgi:hypothetical protein